MLISSFRTCQSYVLKALNEEIKNITKSELKLVDKYYKEYILSDLKPDTDYMVGVMLITNDGNFNDQDIVYGHYTTSCLRKNLHILFIL